MGVFGREGQGFADTVEHQADPHAGGKEHRKPRHEPEFGLFAIVAQGDLAVAGKTNNQGEGNEGPDQQHVKPAEGLNDPCLCRIQRDTCSAGSNDGKPGDQDDQDHRRPEDSRSNGATSQPYALAFEPVGNFLVRLVTIEALTLG